jgi:TusA-related sulfurtransferase
MSDNIIDARGQACPKPLILTKKALRDANVPGEFVVLIDRENPKNNIERLLQDNGVIFRTEKDGDCYRISVIKPEKGI